MNLERKLIKLLDQYIKRQKIASSTYEINIKKKKIYEDLIALLDGNYDKIIEKRGLILSLLNQISQNDSFYKDFKEIISKVEDIKLYNCDIAKEYQKLLNDIQYYELQMSENNKLIESVHRVKNSLKYNKLIPNPNEDISDIEKVLNELWEHNEVRDREIVLYLNMLEYHNEKILSKSDVPEEQEITEFRYNEIPNIVNAGFQEHDVVEVSIRNKGNLDRYALEIIEQIRSLFEENKQQSTEEEFVNLITLYKNKNLPENEFNYVLLKVLDEYLEELITLYKLLLDKDIYTDKESKEEVISEYYKVLNQYIIVNKYYNSSTEYTPDEEQSLDEVKEHSEKRLIYSRSETNITKTRLIADMHDLPYEYYDTVYDLITRFKQGTLSKNEIKTLSNHKSFNSNIELRYDQVRIILKHIKDNIYIVLGVFAKKSDNDIHMYSRIINRITPETDTDERLNMQLELASQTEEELETIVKEKGRKGTR